MAYYDATERARTAEGYLCCEHCGRGLLDREAQRHHIVFRSHGGPTSAGNLVLLCQPCHDAMHHLYQPIHPDLLSHGISCGDAQTIYIVDLGESGDDGE